MYLSLIHSQHIQTYGTVGSFLLEMSLLQSSVFLFQFVLAAPYVGCTAVALGFPVSRGNLCGVTLGDSFNLLCWTFPFLDLFSPSFLVYFSFLWNTRLHPLAFWEIEGVGGKIFCMSEDIFIQLLYLPVWLYVEFQPTYQFLRLKAFDSLSLLKI